MEETVHAGSSADVAIRSVLEHLSHNLRRPIVSLRERLDEMLQDGDRPILLANRPQIEMMTGVCEGLLDLTDDYLAYAALDRGGVIRLVADRLPMSRILGEIDSRFASRAAERRISWSIALEGVDGLVCLDLGVCLQAVSPLVKNALEYAPEGGSVGVVASSSSVDGDRGWTLAIVDDGPGIPAEDRDRVFEPFHRLDREVRSTTDRNGLGLALSKALVGRLGGRIEIDRARAKGTRVVAWFPDVMPADEVNG